MHKDLLLQCEKCGAKGTLFARGGRGLAVVDGQQRAVNRAWAEYQRCERSGRAQAAEGFLRDVRDLRRGRPFFEHRTCGGRCLAFDLGGVRDV